MQSRPVSATTNRPPSAAKQPSTPSMASSLGQWRVQPPPAPFQPAKPSTPANAKFPMSKVPIVDPPAPGTGRQAAAVHPGFPSPGREHLQASPKFNDDRTRITYGIQQSIPEAVRRSVRDNWEKCLLGSEFHQAFILNASIHHANPGAIRRGVRDFGKTMIAAAKDDIIEQMTMADLDQLADRILAKASNSFLDKALELRIKTIEAVPLINALARAERLGYESSDVVDDGSVPAATQPASEHFFPSAASPAAHPVPASQPVSHSPMATLPLHCGICFRKFNYQSSYEHHVKGKVCTRSPNSPGGFKFSCQHCGQGFTTVMGLQYHNANKVCGDFGEPIKGSRSSLPVSTPAASRVNKHASAPTPAVVKSTPKAPSLVDSPNSTPGLHTPHGAVADPYAHLSPEQLDAMQQELREAEIKYGERMRQANMIPDEAEKKQRLDGLSNSFGTKQSLIRKKYGVRLRMRRTKAEIQLERDRMQYKTAAELVADMGVTGASHGPGRSISSALPCPRASAGGDGTSLDNPNNRAAAQTAPRITTLASSLPIPEPNMGEDPRLTDVSMHGGAKRRLSSSRTDSPSHKRVAYSQMGGLSGAAAAAETEDPTLPPRTDSVSTLAKGKGTADEPMALGDTDDSDSEESDSDRDIPAQLPASVRQSLQRSDSAAMGGGSSRPGSSSAK
ncbi:hypothetical protein VM1G_04698 [Cytospora mali]|uniref:Uncharacterized protein n=1 Tax=Cytospora mali TaxID=578113 RepID=A0A194VXX8_CYTMA|nr:hypothetical protein VM1G_04698 [Valsa mali]